MDESKPLVNDLPLTRKCLGGCGKTVRRSSPVCLDCRTREWKAPGKEKRG